MPRHDETTLAVHGLDVDARFVRADVFVNKLRDLITALKTADKLANGKHTHDYLAKNGKHRLYASSLVLAEVVTLPIAARSG